MFIFRSANVSSPAVRGEIQKHIIIHNSVAHLEDLAHRGTIVRTSDGRLSSLFLLFTVELSAFKLGWNFFSPHKLFYSTDEQGSHAG